MGTLIGRLKFRNQDSTQDLNRRLFGVVGKGTYDGDSNLNGPNVSHVATVPGQLQIQVLPFVAISADSMLVTHEGAALVLPVVAGQTQYVVLRAKYVVGGDPILSLEVLSAAAYASDPDRSVLYLGQVIDCLIVLAKITLGPSATQVTNADIDLRENHVVNSVGRFFIRGVVANSGALPNGLLPPYAVVTGDVYLSIADRQFYRWDGSVWETVTDGALSIALNAHITNPTGAHAASAISSLPYGGIVSTNVQLAINELEDDKVGKVGGTPEGDMTGLLTITPSSNTSCLIANNAAQAQPAIVATGGTGNAGVSSTGGTLGIGVVGTGGATAGFGVQGQGTGPAAGVNGIGGPTGGTGVWGQGQNSGYGVLGSGGAPNGTGVLGNGAGLGSGVVGNGGGTDGTGVLGTGGATNGVGVSGQGTGTGTGVLGTGGTSNGAGVTGQGGTGTGTGVSGTGGTGVLYGGTGISGTGGTSLNSGSGGLFTGGLASTVDANDSVAGYGILSYGGNAQGTIVSTGDSYGGHGGVFVGGAATSLGSGSTFEGIGVVAVTNGVSIPPNPTNKIGLYAQSTTGYGVYTTSSGGTAEGLRSQVTGNAIGIHARAPGTGNAVQSVITGIGGGHPISASTFGTGNGVNSLAFGTGAALYGYNNNSAGNALNVTGNVRWTDGGQGSVYTYPSVYTNFAVTPSYAHIPYLDIGTTAKQVFLRGGITLKNTFTGTITATNGNNTITGSGTKFTKELFAGQMVHIAADAFPPYYTVTSVIDDTTATLDANYLGVTGSGKTLRILENNALTAVSRNFFLVPVGVYSVSLRLTLRLNPSVNILFILGTPRGVNMTDANYGSYPTLNSNYCEPQTAIIASNGNIAANYTTLSSTSLIEVTTTDDPTGKLLAPLLVVTGGTADEVVAGISIHRISNVL